MGQLSNFILHQIQWIFFKGAGQYIPRGLLYLLFPQKITLPSELGQRVESKKRGVKYVTRHKTDHSFHFRVFLAYEIYHNSQCGLFGPLQLSITYELFPIRVIAARNNNM